ncbi:MAG: hypothetical protein LC791_06965 [Acidobacteria bacterium]|nr:hypothetical protein [Acidobacteriota bacterium]
MTSQVAAFISRPWSVPESCLDVEVRPLGGGLESAVAGARVTTRGRESGIPRDVVVKQLSDEFAPEADVYQTLWEHLERPPAVQMFGRDVSRDGMYLYLEHATSFSSWPWSDTPVAARVCRELAELHDCAGLPREAVLDIVHAACMAAPPTLPV